MSELKILPNVDKLLNMDEASTLLSIQKSSLYQMVMKRQIQVVKIGKLNRFRKCDLDKFIESHTHEAIH